ncbi:hypothetical protein GCM10022245_45350 [Streptomyces mayteni]
MFMSVVPAAARMVPDPTVTAPGTWDGRGAAAAVAVVPVTNNRLAAAAANTPYGVSVDLRSCV